MILRNSTSLPRADIERSISIALGDLGRFHGVAVWVRPLYNSGSAVRVYAPAPTRVRGFPSASAAKFLVTIGLHHGLEDTWWRIALEKAIREAVQVIDSKRNGGKNA